MSKKTYISVSRGKGFGVGARDSGLRRRCLKDPIGLETTWNDKRWEGTPKKGKLGRRRLWMVPNV